MGIAVANALGEKIVAAPPAALWAHVVLMTGAVASTLPRPWGGEAWALVVVVGLVLVFLLLGSPFAWAVELLGIAGGLYGAYSAYRRVAETDVNLSTFFDPEMTVVTAALLALGGVTLVMPSSRRHIVWADVFHADAFGRGAFVLGALLVASAPATVFGAEERLPSEGMLENVHDASFLGGDEAEEIAFYATENRGGVCLHSIQRSSSGMSCDDPRHDPPTTSRSNDVFSGIVAENVVRVEVIPASGPPQRATVVGRSDLDAAFYYLVEGPTFPEPVDIVGYDARGREVFRRSG